MKNIHQPLLKQEYVGKQGKKLLLAKIPLEYFF